MIAFLMPMSLSERRDIKLGHMHSPVHHYLELQKVCTLWVLENLTDDQSQGTGYDTLSPAFEMLGLCQIRTAMNLG
jgi:hypothetical protein